MDFSQPIADAIASYVNQLLAQHPYLVWSIAHPFWSLILILMAILLLGRLIKAIGWGLEQLMVVILKTPLKLLQPLLAQSWRAIGKIFGHNHHSTQSGTDRAAWIVDRLQTLSQEQELLLVELSTLLDSTAISAKLNVKSAPKFDRM